MRRERRQGARDDPAEPDRPTAAGPPGSTPTPEELDDLRPYLDLAREIRLEVARVAADPAAADASLVEAIERAPRAERERLARAVFERLDADQQWSIIERAYGDAEIRSFLADERAARLDAVRRAGARETVARRARSESRLDTRLLPDGEVLTVGLFRAEDVPGALARGHRSTTTARRLVLRHAAGREPGTYRVLEDVFNPDGGYFVTAEYDQEAWRADRLAAHGSVRLGSAEARPEGWEFEPVLYPGGRVDVETAAGLSPGRLHLGFAMLGDRDVFAS